MEMTLLIGLGIGLIIGFTFSIITDVDSFADRFFTMLTQGKNPHRAE